MSVETTEAIRSPSKTAPAAAQAARTGAGRLFYSGAAVLLLVLAFLGFSRFYLDGRAYPDRELTPPIRTLLILHGAAMSGWIVLFLVQSALIAGRRHRVHMKLGWVTAAVAVASVVLGWKLGIESTRVAPPDLRIWGLPARQFMIVPIVSIVIFAAFVALGVWARKRPAVHKPMMLLATLAAMPAAVSRIDFLNELYVGTAWETLFGPFFMTIVIGGVLLAVRCALLRSLDRAFAVGFVALVIMSVLMVQWGPTRAWDAVAGFLLG